MLGGIGSVTGAVLGGFILGFTEVVAVAIFPELGGYKDAFAFLFLILVLLFRPVGIMGDERLKGAVLMLNDDDRRAQLRNWPLLSSVSRCWPESTWFSMTTLFVSSAPFLSL